jgi:hypothetical protein
MTIQASTAFDAKHPDALAVYCSDGRLTSSIEELLKALGHLRHDTLTLPGGPGLLSHWTARHGEGYTVREAAQFLIRAHGIKTVVLVSHVDCGYYRARYPEASGQEREERGVRDLTAGLAAMGELVPGVAVKAFFARIVGGRVRFDPV